MNTSTKEVNLKEMEQVNGGAGMEDWIQWAIDKYHLNTTREEIMKYIGDYKQYAENWPGKEQVEEIIRQFTNKQWWPESHQWWPAR